MRLSPDLRALSNSFHQVAVRSLKSRTRVGTENIIMEFSAGDANGAHCFNCCFDVRFVRHALAPFARVKRSLDDLGD